MTTTLTHHSNAAEEIPSLLAERGPMTAEAIALAYQPALRPERTIHAFSLRDARVRAAVKQALRSLLVAGAIVIGTDETYGLAPVSPET